MLASGSVVSAAYIWGVRDGRVCSISAVHIRTALSRAFIHLLSIFYPFSILTSTRSKLICTHDVGHTLLHSDSSDY